jgi:predicted branched-subunit amino acid permease
MVFLHKESVIIGFRNILPIMPSVIIFGLILGITGAKSNLSLFITSATSYLIFAGSAQFIVVLLLATEEPLVGIIVAGIIINLRHLLYGAVLNPHIKAKGFKKIILSYLLTDEAFIITTLTQNQETKRIDNKQLFVDDILFGAGFTLWSTWNIVTVIGYLLYSLPFVQSLLTFSSEFIVAATFLGYFIMHYQSSPMKEKYFVLLMSIVSLLLAFFLASSNLIIILLLLGIFISMGLKIIETKSNNVERVIC